MGSIVTQTPPRTRKGKAEPWEPVRPIPAPRKPAPLYVLLRAHYPRRGGLVGRMYLPVAVQRHFSALGCRDLTVTAEYQGERPVAFRLHAIPENSPPQEGQLRIHRDETVYAAYLRGLAPAEGRLRVPLEVVDNDLVGKIPADVPLLRQADGDAAA